MPIFTDREVEYFGEQRLGRLATVNSAGNPHVVPVGFRYNPETGTIDIGGHNMAKSRKWSHAARHPRVAFVVDDVLPPWRPRFIEIRADVELLEDGGQQAGRGFAAEFMRLHPVHIVSRGVDASAPASRKVLD